MSFLSDELLVISISRALQECDDLDDELERLTCIERLASEEALAILITEGRRFRDLEQRALRYETIRRGQR